MPQPAPPTSSPRVAVVGAGIGGLIAAHTLSQHGCHVRLFEASDRVGGAIMSVVDGPWRVELGPNTIPDRQAIVSQWIDRLAIDHQVIQPNHGAKRRYIVRDDTLCALPSSPASFWSTPLLSSRAKLRLLAEPLVPARQPDAQLGARYDESLYNFVSRRFGAEIADYVIDPFIAGTYGSDPKRLSSQYVLKQLRALEQDAGSVIAGGLALYTARARARKKSHDAPKGRSLVGFEWGASTLPGAIAESLPADTVCLETPLRGARQRDDGRWQLSFGEGREPEIVDALIVALPAWAAASLDLRSARDEPIDASALGEITHPPMTMVALGYRRDQIAHPLDAFGMLVPSKEPYSILGAVFASSIFERRAPRDHALIVAFLGGRDARYADLSTQAQQAIVTRDLGRLIGARGEPVRAWTRRWDRAIPQYEVGYARLIERIKRTEARHPGIYFTGNWRAGISVCDTITCAAQTAQRALDALPRSPAPLPTIHHDDHHLDS